MGFQPKFGKYFINLVILNVPTPPIGGKYCAIANTFFMINSFKNIDY